MPRPRSALIAAWAACWLAAACVGAKKTPTPVPVTATVAVAATAAPVATSTPAPTLTAEPSETAAATPSPAADDGLVIDVQIMGEDVWLPFETTSEAQKLVMQAIYAELVRMDPSGAYFAYLAQTVPSLENGLVR